MTDTKLTLDTLMLSWPDFAGRIQAFTTDLGLAELGLECDHVALRVNSADTAQALADAFAARGEIISNNIINGRPILIIKLHQPLMLGDQSVYCVELPFPGDKLYPVEGWEHAELVLTVDAKDCDTLAQALISRVPEIQSVLDGKRDIKVKLSSPKGEQERLPNPTIAFKRDGICVKVHAHTIEAVIASEQAE
ncbi:VOC family protein [Shewanella submarina]|uniref:VOC family protein n=1 Tax=Shewanella submarina TaxID=2016376 RepID=A0ABV7GD61_9GAMM|nr:VOC family protein [Shewanella submarina]MCL1039732.1 VOC family protein [Shewanella submarina]